MRDHAFQQTLVEPRGRSGDRSIRLTCRGTHCRRELAQRRRVDQVHRVAERDADRDGDDLHQRAQPVLARVAGDHMPR